MKFPIKRRKGRLAGDSLEGQLLVAMPTMTDKRFARSVVYMCAHSTEGAMGLIINQVAKNISFTDLLAHLEIAPKTAPGRPKRTMGPTRPVHVGGPVEGARGFVLHSADYADGSTTLKIDKGICLTATVEIVRAIANGAGPEKSILALGYASWSPGQLEGEFQANGWLHCPADPDIVFAHELGVKYDRALAKIGVDLSHFVAQAGRA